MPKKLLPEPSARIGLLHMGPLRFRLLQTVEPLIERFEPCVCGSFGTSPFRPLPCISLCVAPGEIEGPDRDEKHGGKRHRQGADPL